MAKKSTGASEINGFIAVTNEKLKTTSKVGAAKQISSTPAKTSKQSVVQASKDDKNVKSQGRIIKRSPEEIKRTETNSKIVGKSSSVTSTSKINSKKSATDTVPNASRAKVAPTQGQTTAVKSSPATSKTRVKGDPKPVKTLPTSVTKTDLTTTNTGTNKKLVPPSNASRSVKKDAAQKASDIKTKAKAQQGGKGRTVQQTTQAVTRISRTKTKRDVDQKAGIASKPKTQVKSLKDTSQSNIIEKAQDSAMDDDEEEEGGTKSLPHITPEKLEVSQVDNSQDYGDDHEDYESDFEDETQTEASMSESSTALKPTTQHFPIANPPRVAFSKGNSPDIAQSSKMKNEQMITTLTPASSIDPVAQGREELANPHGPGRSLTYDYDDDFEDYSSDFEDDSESGFTSSNATQDSSSASESSEEHEVEPSKPGSKGKVVEEERKLDSGNYDLKSSILKSDVFKQSQLNYIKEAISRENTMFKDGVPAKKPPSPPPYQIMDFKAAYERSSSESSTVTTKAKKREDTRREGRPS